MFLGDTVDFQVNVGDSLLLATAHPNLRTPVGDPIFVRIRSEKCIALGPMRARCAGALYLSPRDLLTGVDVRRRS